MSTPTSNKLQQPKWVKVKTLAPCQTYIDVIVKVYKTRHLLTQKRSDNTSKEYSEALVGDETGCLILTLCDDDIKLAQEGAVLEIINAKIEMAKFYMRLVVDKWGKIRPSTRTISHVNLSNNLSNVEFELVDKTDENSASAE
ncbi:uncharacterized protein LOC126325510 [Schistocerca gregaria]|uniref:uncharacterized protein LOC126325510 n=1 Tax=Schistocerca gregaria TaxID=7010 RepID=UPI00211E55A6|nr:uncharacterized protein LOC126325510 [Schistocerca gregaria]